jgi:MFS family permease
MPPSEKPKETNPKILAVIVASAIIMQQIDATAITTALPQMAISLNTDPIRLTIAVTSYLLSIAVFIPVSGWAADRFGGRTVFRAAIALFTLGSILCGISENVVQLTAARVLQGLGGAMMVPVGRLVLFRSVEKSQLIPVMAYLQVPAQLGPVLGPLLGGFITTYISWRWIFFVNVPLGILGMFLVTRYFDNPKEANPRPMDWVGFILTGVSLSCIMYSIEAIGRGASEAIVASAVRSLASLSAHSPCAICGGALTPPFWTCRCSATPLFAPASAPVRCSAPAEARWSTCCRCCFRSRSA